MTSGQSWHSGLRGRGRKGPYRSVFLPLALRSRLTWTNAVKRWQNTVLPLSAISAVDQGLPRVGLASQRPASFRRETGMVLHEDRKAPPPSSSGVLGPGAQHGVNDTTAGGRERIGKAAICFPGGKEYLTQEVGISK